MGEKNKINKIGLQELFVNMNDVLQNTNEKNGYMMGGNFGRGERILISFPEIF